MGLLKRIFFGEDEPEVIQLRPGIKWADEFLNETGCTKIVSTIESCGRVTVYGIYNSQGPSYETPVVRVYQKGEWE